MTQAMETANDIYADRTRTARALQKEGKKVIGYVCPLIPVEIIAAGGMVPLRITGDADKSAMRSNEYYEPNFCSFLRSFFDLAMEGHYDFLDGLIVPHSCDHSIHLYNFWTHHRKPDFAYQLNIPHTISGPSLTFLEAELASFTGNLGRFAETDISAAQISAAILEYNKNRALVRRLYDARKTDPPKISGTEIMKILVAISQIPVDESNALLEAAVEAVEREKTDDRKKSPRLMIFGCGLDNTNFVELVENCGADVVMDDICLGARTHWYDVAASGDPLKNLAARYLTGVKCPRTFVERTGAYQQDLENRFGHVYEFARRFDVQGVILHVIRYCDTFCFDIPDISRFLEEKGLPVLVLEEDYIISSVNRVKNRIEAFLEMVMDAPATMEEI